MQASHTPSEGSYSPNGSTESPALVASSGKWLPLLRASSKALYRVKAGASAGPRTQFQHSKPITATLPAPPNGVSSVKHGESAGPGELVGAPSRRGGATRTRRSQARTTNREPV